MTRDEIMQMEAGREMDALVAELVMCWTCVEKTSWSNFRADGTPFGGGAEWRGVSPEHSSEFDPPMYPIKNYSTDIDAAWRIVEKHPHYFSLNRSNDNNWIHAPFLDRSVWHCRFYAPEKFKAMADTAPLAICRAALLVELLKEDGNG